MSAEESHDDAPRRARRNDTEAGLAHVGRAVLIDRPRSELFAYWRDFQNLPNFMPSVDTIRAEGDGRLVWTIRAPVGQTVEIITEMAEMVQDEVIAWRSVEGSEITTSGRVSFTDAPAGRGTVVTAEIAYKPPAGTVGRLFAKLFGTEPNIQARHELKRFKMLMETGEIATGDYHRPETKG